MKLEGQIAYHEHQLEECQSKHYHKFSLDLVMMSARAEEYQKQYRDLAVGDWVVLKKDLDGPFWSASEKKQTNEYESVCPPNFWCVTRYYRESGSVHLVHEEGSDWLQAPRDDLYVIYQVRNTDHETRLWLASMMFNNTGKRWNGETWV